MPKLKTIFMFSGQGSQYYQMGRPLYDRNAVFRYWMDRLDACGRREAGASAIGLIYDPKRMRADTFERTPLGGVAIFMVEYALAMALEAEGLRPDLTLGASLGTYAAAAVAGAIAPEAALIAIVQHSDIVRRHCPPGGMLAILAEPALFDLPELCSRSELAALNFSGHFAVAGLEHNLVAIERFLSAEGVIHQRVPVSHAFHSQWIDAAHAPLLRHFEGLPLAPLTIPLVCCAQARTFHSIPDGFFWSSIRRPIEFQRTVAELVREGPFRYVDAGPSGTLAGFMRYLLPAGSPARVQRVLAPFGSEIKNFEAAIAG